MAQRNNWYVITGGPSSGKTTLIDMLAAKGYKTFPEAARVVIDEGLASGLTLEQIRADEKSFQDKVLNKKVAIESQHKPDVLTIFDRGMYDTVAYLKFYGWDIDASTRQKIQAAHYKGVFLLEPLPSFAKDYARTESHEFTHKLTELLDEAYSAAGLKPIRVPNMTPEDRLQFILTTITSEEGNNA